MVRLHQIPSPFHRAPKFRLNLPMNLPTSPLRLALLALLALAVSACEKAGKPPVATQEQPKTQDPAPQIAKADGETPGAEAETPGEESAEGGLPILAGGKAPLEPSKPAAEDPAREGNPDFGRIEDGRYTNPFFAFSLSVPDRYVTAMGLDLGPIANKGAELLTGDENLALGARLKENRPKYFKLLSISEQPLDVPQERNPTILIVAERLDEPSTGPQYLEQLDNLLTNSLLPYTRTGEIETIQKGNLEFFLATYKLEKMESRLFQSYIVTLRKGYALCFIITDTRLQSLASLRDFAMGSRFEPLIGEGGTLATATQGENPEEALSPKRPAPEPGTTVFLKEEEEEDIALPELPQLRPFAPAVATGEEPADAPIEPELPSMAPVAQPSPDSRPALRRPGSGVPPPATTSLPPLPDPGRDGMQGADEMGATPLSIEPADPN